MGYNLEAFICKEPDANLFIDNFTSAIKISIGQGIALIPLTKEFFNQITSSIASKLVDPFDCLTENIETEILTILGNKKLAYVEAEYFGGRGGQVAIFWENNKRTAVFPHGKGNINQVLKDFGVIAAGPGCDEFSTLNLDRYRKTRHWVQD